MKHKQIKELHHKNLAELKKELMEKRQELMTLKLERKVKPAKNTRSTRILQDDIARILTVIRLQELKEEKV